MMQATGLEIEENDRRGELMSTGAIYFQQLAKKNNKQTLLDMGQTIHNWRQRGCLLEATKKSMRRWKTNAPNQQRRLA